MSRVKPPAGVYCRISEDREGRELGVDRQERDCRALAARRGLRVYRVYTDNDISASTRSRRERPEYKRLLADARAGRVAVIVAYTSGRLTRRPREHEDLIELAEQHGVRIEYVASPSFDLNTSAGRRVARILAATDAGEAEDISERVLRAQLQAAQEGRPHGGTRRYGYNRPMTRVVRAEAKIIREAAKRVIAGEGLAAIAADLNRRQVPTVTGARWSHTVLRSMLSSPHLAGLREHPSGTYPARWPAILKRDTLEAVQARITRRRADFGYATNARRYLMSGIAVCGSCGRTVQAAGNRGANGYACVHPDCGRRVFRSQRHVDAYLVGRVVARLAGEELAGARTAAARDPGALAELEALEGRRAATVAAFGAVDGANPADLAVALVDLDRRITAARDRLASQSRAGALAGLDGLDRDGFLALPLERQRAVVVALFSRVEILPTRSRGGPGFDPALVRITPR